GLDPLQARLDRVTSRQGRELLESVARQSDWTRAPARQDGVIRKGRGLAYSHVVERQPGETTREQWSAWAVDVSVDTHSGRLSIDRLTIGHDSSALAEPGVQAEAPPALADRLSRWAQQLLAP